MTIYELDDILALMDFEKISEEIERRGYRRAGEVGEWEYKPEIVLDESGYHQSAKQIDEAADKEYYGTLYKDNKTYKGYTFITLTLFVIMREHDNVAIPKRSLLFTDAPYNEEYVRERNSPYKCDRCGKEYIKKELLEHREKYYCGDCFCRIMDYETARMLAEEIIRRKGKL